MLDFISDFFVEDGEQVQELGKSSKKPGFSTGKNSQKAEITSKKPGFCVSPKLMTLAEDRKSIARSFARNFLSYSQTRIYGRDSSIVAIVQEDRRNIRQLYWARVAVLHRGKSLPSLDDPFVYGSLNL